MGGPRPWPTRPRPKEGPAMRPKQEFEKLVEWDTRRLLGFRESTLWAVLNAQPELPQSVHEVRMNPLIKCFPAFFARRSFFPTLLVPIAT